MTYYIQKLAFTIIILSGLGVMSACSNTISGIGSDVEEMGDAIQDAAN